jgi:hypothetical protein
VCCCVPRERASHPQRRHRGVHHARQLRRVWPSPTAAIPIALAVRGVTRGRPSRSTSPARHRRWAGPPGCTPRPSVYYEGTGVFNRVPGLPSGFVVSRWLQ